VRRGDAADDSFSLLEILVLCKLDRCRPQYLVSSANKFRGSSEPCQLHSIGVIAVTLLNARHHIKWKRGRLGLDCQ